MTQAAREIAKSWSSTLRLPKSTFPPRPAPSDLPKYLQRCTDDLYAWQRRERLATKPFIFHDGPPYANGSLHVGHALNKILKDIICRTKLAEGRRVDYTPGWDTHGLPIELKALENHGWKRGENVDPSAIRKAARAFAQSAVNEQMEGFKSWAIMGNWDGHWKTMDVAFETDQLSVFRAMARSGLIYRKNKPVYWSPSSKTALAEAELEYREDHVSTAAVVKFPILDLPGDKIDSPTHAVIWTTTPWTLPANQAIAINSELGYCRVRCETHGFLLVAKSRLAYLKQLVGKKMQMVDETFDIDLLVGARYRPPLCFDPSSSTRPFIHADFVSADAGTGLVHSAPGHGMEDYDALQRLIASGEVEVKAPVDARGYFTKDAAPGNPDLLAGRSVLDDGNRAVLDALAEEGLVLTSHEYTHKYPYDWRTKEPVIVRATAQWFADISSIREDTVNALEKVTYLPSTGKSRLRAFVDSRQEWCISRQRAWGVPIPALFNRDTGEAVLTDASVGHIIDTIRAEGVDAWWSDKPDDSKWVVPGLGGSDYVRGTDTMDVWFDSGTSWAQMDGLQGSTRGALADVYLEGTDQHRGWFQSSLLTYIAYQKSVSTSPPSAPYKTLITHGFTLDGEGRKMSKSIGNVIAPAEIISGVLSGKQELPTPTKSSKKVKQKGHPLGPDVLRLWAASSDFTKDILVSETTIQTTHSSLHKYRVTFKLLLGALSDFSPGSAIPYGELPLTDRLALYHLHAVTAAVQSASDGYEFHKAVTALNRYVNADLSAFYIEAIKDSLYCDAVSSARRVSVQTTLYNILISLQNILAPITPLLVEESWAYTPDSIKSHPAVVPPHQRILSKHDEEPSDEWSRHHEDARDLATRVLPVLNAISKAVKAAQERLRAAKKIGSSLESDVHIHLRSSIGAMHLLTPADLVEILVVSNLRVTLVDDSGDSNSGTQLSVTAPSERDGGDGEMEAIELDGSAVGYVDVRSPADAKCARCWKYVVPKRREEEAPAQELCGRCAHVVAQL